MKAVNRNLAHNPYGAPTALMPGVWMNLKRVCRFEMSQAAAALKSPQGQLGLAVIWTRHVQQVLKARSLIAISTIAIVAKNPMIAIGYKIVPTFLFWEATSSPVSCWCERKGFVYSFRHPVHGSLGDLMRLVLLGLAALQNKRISQQSISTGGITVNDFALYLSRTPGKFIWLTRSQSNIVFMANKGLLMHYILMPFPIFHDYWKRIFKKLKSVRTHNSHL